MDKQTLEALGIDVELLKEQIVEAATSLLVSDLRTKIFDEVKTSMIKELPIRVETTVTELARHVLLERYQPIDTYGHPNGEPTTLREVFIKAMENWWNQPVDSKGQVTSYRSTKRYQYIAETMMAQVMEKELKAQFDQLLKDYTAKLETGLRDAIMKLVEREFRRLK